jgi:urease gamma subunit
MAHQATKAIRLAHGMQLNHGQLIATVSRKVRNGVARDGDGCVIAARGAPKFCGAVKARK